MLTEAGRRQFKLKMIPEFLKVRVCSGCGLLAGQAPKVKHPFQDEFDTIQQNLIKNPTDRKLRSHLHKIRSKIHHNSRCCGVKYKEGTVDNWDAIYSSWVNRYEGLRVPVEVLREENPSGAGCDDDFLIMQYRWSLSDAEIRYRMRICRDEDVRQAALRDSQEQLIFKGATGPVKIEPKSSGRRLLGLEELTGIPVK